MRSELRRVLLALLASGWLLGGCDTGPLMTPGQDCLTCHSESGGAGTFTVAGTVYDRFDARADHGLAGAEVVITDANGKQLSLATNAAGNFYSDERLTFPIAAEVRRGDSVRRMGVRPQNGACSSCHNRPPTGGAEGRVFVGPHDSLAPDGGATPTTPSP